MSKNQDLKLFGKKIKEARLSMGLSQQDLAEKLGTSKSVISGYESGNNDPRQSMVVKLAEVLNVSLNWLMADEDQEGYYINEETKEVANAIAKDKELKLLFDAARDAPAEDLKAVHEILKALKRKEQGYDDD